VQRRWTIGDRCSVKGGGVEFDDALGDDTGDQSFIFLQIMYGKPARSVGGYEFLNVCDND
jgi:hypothetical protein